MCVDFKADGHTSSGQSLGVKVPVRLDNGDTVTCVGTLTTGIEPTLEFSVPRLPDGSCPQIALGNAPICGTLDDGSSFRANIELLVVGNDPVEAIAHVRITLTDVTIKTACSLNVQRLRTWSFGLTNVSLSIGDERFVQREGAEAVSTFLNRVRFRVAGREWVLTDISPGVAEVKSATAMAGSLGTGVLETDILNDNECDEVSGMADDIGALISLATGRDVRWYLRMITGQGAGGLFYFKRTVWGYPYGRRASPPIDNGARGALKEFLETCFDPLRADRAWFYTTLDYFLCARLDWALQVRCTILNLLLDRISTKVVGDNRGGEIHQDLPSSVEKPEFQRNLHAVLNSLPNWTFQRTLAIVDQIKRWNSTPSFPATVTKTCAKLELPGPRTGFVGPRHKLLHLGELKPPEGITEWQYATELECLVLMIILRLLCYNGAFYHAQHKSNRVTLRELRPQSAGEPPQSPEKEVVIAKAPASTTPKAVKVIFALLEPNAKQVSLGGDFNGWTPRTMPLKGDGAGNWRTTVVLSPGRYEYKFLVDGQWIADPLARVRVWNHHGTLNSVIEVPG